MASPGLRQVALAGRSRLRPAHQAPPTRRPRPPRPGAAVGNDLSRRQARFSPAVARTWVARAMPAERAPGSRARHRPGRWVLALTPPLSPAGHRTAGSAAGPAPPGAASPAEGSCPGLETPKVVSLDQGGGTESGRGRT